MPHGASSSEQTQPTWCLLICPTRRCATAITTQPCCADWDRSVYGLIENAACTVDAQRWRAKAMSTTTCTRSAT